MSIVKSLIGTNYKLLRAPASLFQDRVLKRLPDDSLIRLGADGTLGLLDAIVGRITDDEQLRLRGGEMGKDVAATLQARAEKMPFNPAKAMTKPESQPMPFMNRGAAATGIDVDPYMSTD